MKRLLVLTAVLAAALSGAGAASAASTTGTWTLDPAQSDTTSSSTTTSTAYKVAVQQPINPDGSSSWPAKRGVVPVQFSLATATKTTTTTTETVGQMAFDSLKSTGDSSSLTFGPSGGLTFGGISMLAANFTFTSGDCYGGAPRWSIVVNHNGVDEFVYVYYGSQAGGGTFVNCPSDAGTNMVGGTNNVELGSVAPGIYGSWATALARYSNDPVVWAGLVLDGGWNADQVLTLNSATVNDNTWVPKAAGTFTSSQTSYGPFAPTCTLPTATISLIKNPGTDNTPIDETLAAGSSDTGGVYRQVNCNYVYNLDASNLGVGKFNVYVNIGGQPVDGFATFGLR